MNFMTFHILGIVTPTDELILFRGVGLNHQPDGDLCGKLGIELKH